MILGFQDYIEFAVSRKYEVHFARLRTKSPDTKNAILITQVRAERLVRKTAAITQSMALLASLFLHSKVLKFSFQIVAVQAKKPLKPPGGAESVQWWRPLLLRAAGELYKIHYNRGHYEGMWAALLTAATLRGINERRCLCDGKRVGALPECLRPFRYDWRRFAMSFPKSIW
jgi:hypothetical protein